MRSAMRRRGGRHGFTMIELLTVVGIIMLLVSILLPLVSTMWKRAQDTDTRALLGQLASAIQNYRNDFGSYPGPVRDEMIYGYGPPPAGTTPLIPLSFVSATAPQGDPALPTQPTVMTSSQNLLLGLLGGLQFSTSPQGVYYNPSQISRSVANLNMLNTAQYKTYYDIKNKTDLSRDSSGNLVTTWVPNSSPQSTSLYPWTTGTQIPEFMDHYPMPHPIIYLRARVSAPSVVDGPLPTAGSAVPNQSSQYYSSEMSPYWIGGSRETTTSVYSPNGSSAPFPAYWETTQGSAPPTTLVTLWPTALTFFQNPALNDGYTPRSKDSFILISAGSDGYYGSADDIVYPAPQ